MTALKQAKNRKTLIAASLGFISGVGGMTAFLSMTRAPDWTASEVAAGAVGVVYLASGLFVLLGVAAPGIGARVLNVSDAEELIEQRPLYTGSAISIITFGIMLLCLAAADQSGLVPRWAAMASVAIAGLTTVTIYRVQWKLYDELWRQLSWESAAFASMLSVPVLTLWGAAVHLGYVGAMDGLGVVAFVSAAILAGAAIATGRRGLLAQR